MTGFLHEWNIFVNVQWKPHKYDPSHFEDWNVNMFGKTFLGKKYKHTVQDNTRRNDGRWILLFFESIMMTHDVGALHMSLSPTIIISKIFLVTLYFLMVEPPKSRISEPHFIFSMLPAINSLCPRSSICTIHKQDWYSRYNFFIFILIQPIISHIFYL